MHRLVNFIPHSSPSPFPRLTGRMNVSHGDDKNPLVAQKKGVVASQAGGILSKKGVSKKKYLPGIPSKIIRKCYVVI